MKRIEICFSPAMFAAYEHDYKDSIVVIVDIFRATTTISTAFKNGVGRIIPVASIEEAQAYKAKGYLVGAERNVKQCDFADFGNSPFQYTRERVEGKDVVLTTTNCTHAVDIAKNAPDLIIGSFLNIGAVADFCEKSGKDVLVLCAGWNDRFNLEDTLFGGALVGLLQKKGFKAISDASQVALSMWEDAKSDVAGYLKDSEHIKRLKDNNLQDSVGYCLTCDLMQIVPVYDKESKSFISF